MPHHNREWRRGHDSEREQRTIYDGFTKHDGKFQRHQEVCEVNPVHVDIETAITLIELAPVMLDLLEDMLPYLNMTPQEPDTETLRTRIEEVTYEDKETTL